jgi:hypothetical protein
MMICPIGMISGIILVSITTATRTTLLIHTKIMFDPHVVLLRVTRVSPRAATPSRSSPLAATWERLWASSRGLPVKVVTVICCFVSYIGFSGRRRGGSPRWSCGRWQSRMLLTGKLVRAGDMATTGVAQGWVDSCARVRSRRSDLRCPSDFSLLPILDVGFVTMHLMVGELVVRVRTGRNPWSSDHSAGDAFGRC